MAHTKVRNRPYVRILFKVAGAKRAAWYWAIKIKDGAYKRCKIDGETEMAHSKKNKTYTEEVFFGQPIEERKAIMNCNYCELEVL